MYSSRKRLVFALSSEVSKMDHNLYRFSGFECREKGFDPEYGCTTPGIFSCGPDHRNSVFRLPKTGRWIEIECHNSRAGRGIFSAVVGLIRHNHRSSGLQSFGIHHIAEAVKVSFHCEELGCSKGYLWPEIVTGLPTELCSGL